MSDAPPVAHVLADGSEAGPCVVFVHGIEDGWRTWEALAAQLGHTWRSIALDMPWRAGNDYRWRWNASPGDWVRAGLDAAVGHRRCVLVGHSFGANAVLARLADGEPRAEAAVLTAPFFRPAHAPVTWELFDRSRQALERQIGNGMRLRLRGTPPPDLFAVMLAKACDRIGPVGFLAVFEEYVASGHLALSEVAVPVLVMAGENDPGIFRPHLEDLGRQLVRGTVRCAPDLDHFGHISRAAELARAIEGFTRPEQARSLAAREE